MNEQEVNLLKQEIQEIVEKIKISLHEDEIVSLTNMYLSTFLSKYRKVEKIDMLLQEVNKLFQQHNKSKLVQKINLLCFLNYKNVSEKWLDLQKWDKNELIDYFYNILKLNDFNININGLLKKEIPKEFLNIERFGKKKLNLLEQTIGEVLRKYGSIKYKKLYKYLQENTYSFFEKEKISLEFTIKNVNLKNNEIYFKNIIYSNYLLLSKTIQKKLNEKKIVITINKKAFELDVEHLLIYQDFCNDLENICYSKCYKKMKKINNVEELKTYYPTKIENLSNLLKEFVLLKRKNAHNKEYKLFWSSIIIQQNYEQLQKDLHVQSKKINQKYKI
jgi:hypothetical protein